VQTIDPVNCTAVTAHAVPFRVAGDTSGHAGATGKRPFQPTVTWRRATVRPRRHLFRSRELIKSRSKGEGICRKAKARSRKTLERAFVLNNPGDFLLSHAVSRAVPSAPAGLTSVFGMGTGVTLPTKSPENFSKIE
jgi:hypothetical protein